MPEVLETFPNQFSGRDYEIEITCPEFTAVCPKTGQPDFATIVITYVPDLTVVELKSLKLYLVAYRDRGIFYEHAINTILDDLVAACRPRRMTVVGRFTPRGGISSGDGSIRGRGLRRLTGVSARFPACGGQTVTRPPLLTLTTDFGPRGPYVAAIKGVVLSIAPLAQIIDVTHAVTPQDILEGSFVLAGVFDAFPAGTVHLAVIDPGVGTDRSIIAVSLEDHWFIVPDNGLITCVARGRSPRLIYEISNPALRRKTVSATFHGRDIMAPAAAHLLLGGDPAVLGPARPKFIALKNFEPNLDDRGFLAEVIFRDSFGNLITNIEGSRLEGEAGANWVIEVAGERVEGLCRTYADQASGTLVALVGSSGWVEVAVVNGDASRALNAGPGSTVWMRKDLSR